VFKQSYCLLVSSSKAETARQRLLEQSRMACLEMDMRFRSLGWGMLGTRQSGLLTLR